MSHLGARLAAYVDGELPRGTRELVAAHLHVCNSCRAEVEAESRLKTGLTALGGPDPSAGLMSSLLDLAGSGGTPPPPGPPFAGPRPHSRLAPGHAPAPRGPAGWAAFAPSRLVPAGVSPASSGLRPAKRRSHLVAGMVSAAAVTLGAAFLGGDLSEPQPVQTPSNDLFAARNANHTDPLRGTAPASVLNMELATGLPDTGFFQPVGVLTRASIGGYTDR